MKILDGGISTELERVHFKNISGHPLWSSAVLLSDPQSISAVHVSYLEAGSTILTTCSYQISIQGCEKAGYEHPETVFYVLIDKAVECARDAIDRYTKSHSAMIAGSIGSYGAILANGSEYTGEYGSHVTADTIKDTHRPRVRRLLENKVDVILFETVPCLLEARAIHDLMSLEFPSAVYWISFVCRDKSHVGHGEPLVDCIDAVLSSCSGIGINCIPPKLVSNLLKTISTHVFGRKDIEILCYPNSGEEWDGIQKIWLKSQNKDMIWDPLQWIQDGATTIGGCCRTTPEQIKQVVSILSAGEQHK